MTNETSTRIPEQVAVLIDEGEVFDFVCREEHETLGSFSIYSHVNGDERYIAFDGTLLVDLDGLDLPALWREFLEEGSGHWQTDAFLVKLQGLVLSPDSVNSDVVTFCRDCLLPGFVDDMHSVHNGFVCEPHAENYTTCDSCDERYRYTTVTLDDTDICEYCRDSNWSFCDNCDGYYHSDDGGHDHDDDGCDCASPAQQFTIRNDGDPPLVNDKRVTVTLPAGVISNEGLSEITMYLREIANTARMSEGDVEWEKWWNLAFQVPALGDKWQTKEGNFTKRLSRYAYKTFALKVTPLVLSKVGCIARDHSAAVDFAIETTRNLNLSPSDFGNDDSCWWGSYGTSRCALKSNGGFGLRSYNEYDRVSGRAWVLPLAYNPDVEILKPTFETLEPAAFIVFNGYGTLSGYTPARVMSHMAGMTYRKVNFTCPPMYINGESGYLVAPEEIASNYTDGALNLSVDYHSNLFDQEAAKKANQKELVNA